MRQPSRHVLAIGVVVLVATAGVLAAGAPAAPQSDAATNDSGAGIPTGEVNTTDADVEIVGVETDLLGKSVAYTGDVNGDGHDDVAIGAPFNDSTAHRAGAVYLFFGPLENASLNASDADVTLFGEASGDQAGKSIAAGDVDGDGYDDLVIGAPFNAAAGQNAGAVYVVPGGENMSATANLSG